MGQNGQGPTLSSADLSKKRKRGRPRKDENLVQDNSIRAALARSIGPSNNGHTGMLGQMVNGYIDGMFDGGYLITVKVGNTYLKGLAFLPGQVVPITAESDVAPNAKMIRRHDISTPLDSQSKHSSPLLQSEKNNEPRGYIPLFDSQFKHNSPTLPTKDSNERPEIPASITLDHVTPARPISAVTIEIGDRSAAYRVSSTDNSQKIVPGSSLENLFFSEHTPGSELENQAPAMSQLKVGKFCEQNKVPYDFGDLNVTGGSNICTEQTNLKKAMELGSPAEPTLDLGQQNQSASVVSHLQHDDLVVQGKVLQNSDASTLIEEANMSLGLKGVLEQGGSEPTCADFLGKFPKNGSSVNDEAVVSELEVMNDGMGKPDLQLNKAFNHAELEKPSNMPSKYISPMTDIDASSGNITKERPSDPSVDVCKDKTMSPGINLPNEIDKFKQATSNPTCMQAILAESELLSEGSILPEASSGALKSNLLVVTSDMGTVSSKPRLAAEASCISNVIETSISDDRISAGQQQSLL